MTPNSNPSEFAEYSKAQHAMRMIAGWGVLHSSLELEIEDRARLLFREAVKDSKSENRFHFLQEVKWDPCAF
jgi:hypothetical protein